MGDKLQREIAYEKIKDAIVTLRYEMGKNINEKELCNELKLGRTPVREALQQLEQQGLVVVVPRKGVHVSYISLEDFKPIFETRIMLETYCIAEATNCISISVIENLKKLIIDSDPLINAMDVDGLVKLDRKIHMDIVKSLNNKYIEQIAEQIYDLVTRMWYLSYKTRNKEDLRQSVMSHIRTLDFMAIRNVGKSIESNRKHIDGFVSQVYKNLMPTTSPSEGIEKHYE